MSFRLSLSSLILAASLPALLNVEARAQTIPSGKTRMFLWENRRAPYPIPKPSYLTDTTYSATDSIKNPWVIHYAPTTASNGTAIILMPGGGYRNLAGWDTEGLQGAPKLAGYGITVFILKYRYSPYQQPNPMWDGQRAVRWVRANAARFNINPNRVGVLGFSSGGHVASTVSTHFDAGLVDSTSPHWYPGVHDSIDLYSSRPAFQALVYPMTTMQASFAYTDGRNALLGSNPPQTLVDYLSNEKQVTANTPPTWINWGTTDNLVNPLNSTVYRDSLLAKGVVVQTVPVATSSHSYSTARLDSLATWLGARGYLTAIHPRAARPIPASALIPSGKRVDARGRVSERPTGVPLNALPETPQASEARR